MVDLHQQLLSVTGPAIGSRLAETRGGSQSQSVMAPSSAADILPSHFGHGPPIVHSARWPRWAPQSGHIGAGCADRLLSSRWTTTSTIARQRPQLIVRVSAIMPASGLRIRRPRARNRRIDVSPKCLCGDYATIGVSRSRGHGGCARLRRSTTAVAAVPERFQSAHRPDSDSTARPAGGLPRRFRITTPRRRTPASVFLLLGGVIRRAHDEADPCLRPGPGFRPWEQHGEASCECCASLHLVGRVVSCFTVGGV